MTSRLLAREHKGYILAIVGSFTIILIPLVWRLFYSSSISDSPNTFSIFEIILGVMILMAFSIGPFAFMIFWILSLWQKSSGKSSLQRLFFKIALVSLAPTALMILLTGPGSGALFLPSAIVTAVGILFSRLWEENTQVKSPTKTIFAILGVFILLSGIALIYLLSIGL